MDTRSRQDPVEQVYDARIRGVCLIGTRAGTRQHLHGGCWVTPTAHRPPRLAVSFPKEFEGAAIVRRGGAFAVSLVAEDERELNDALFSGRHSLDALGRGRFLRATSGCPVLAGAVGYFDCRLAEAVEFPDFLLAVGDVRAAAVLHPERRNLTVNEIQRRGVPEPAAAVLPLKGFDDLGPELPDAPVQGGDPAIVEAVYARRRWGLFLAAARAGNAERVEVCGWAVQCSHEPPRMLACLGRGGAAADLVRRHGRFSLSLLGEDQLPLALRVRGGAGAPADLDGARWRREGEDPPFLEDAVAHFTCAVEGEIGGDTDFAGFHGPVVGFGWGRREAAQLRTDQLAAGEAGARPAP